MISYLKGRVLNISKSSVLLSVENVGYEIIVLDVLSYKENDYIEVFVHTDIKETNITLYGFNSFKLKTIFKTLISISGIGPNRAIKILALVDKLKQVDEYDIVTIKGISSSKALDIITKLKQEHKDVIKNTTYSNVVNDLLILGYEKHKLEEAIRHIGDKKLAENEVYNFVIDYIANEGEINE